MVPPHMKILTLYLILEKGHKPRLKCPRCNGTGKMLTWNVTHLTTHQIQCTACHGKGYN